MRLAGFLVSIGLVYQYSVPDRFALAHTFFCRSCLAGVTLSATRSGVTIPSGGFFAQRLAAQARKPRG